MEPVTKRLQLSEAVSIAIQNNSAVQIAKERQKEIDAAYWERLSFLGLKVDGSLGYQRQKDAAAGGRARFDGKSFDLYDFELQATQPLLRRGGLEALRIGSLEKEIQEIELERSLRELRLEVFQAYQNALFYAEQLKLLEQTKNVFSKSLKVTQERERIGQVQSLDVLQIKAEIALIEPKITKAKNEKAVRMAELNRLLVLPETENFELEGEWKLPALEDLQKIQESESLTPAEVLISQKRLEIQSKETIVSLGSHWPELEAAGRFGRSGSKESDLFDEDSNSWAVGLSLSVPLFSSLSYFSERSKLESQERQKAYELQGLVRQNQYEKIKSREDLKANYQILSASRTARDLVRKALTQARKEHRLGGIDYLRLLDFEKNLLQAEIDLQVSQQDAVEALSDFFRSFGISSEQLIALMD